jgi:hypothetical protein
MADVSPLPNAIARKTVQVVLQRLATVKNQTVAEAIGKDESTVSRIASGEVGIKLNDLHAFIDALGLKIVDKNQRCIDSSIYEAYKTLATAAINAPSKLDWDEPA